MSGSQVKEGSETDAEFLLLPPLRVETCAVLSDYAQTDLSTGASNETTVPPYYCSLLVCSNKFGFTVYGTLEGFAVVASSDLLNTIRGAPSHSRPPVDRSTTVHINVLLTAKGPVTHLRLSADELSLVVATADGSLLVYPMAAFFKPSSDSFKNTIDPTSTTIAPIFTTHISGGAIIDIAPNPDSLPGLVAVLSADRRVHFVDLSGTVTLVATENITAFSWSRKGKQLACGTADGKILQISPSGEVKREIPRPSVPLPDAAQVLQVLWVEDRVFVAIFAETSTDPSYPPRTQIFIVSQDPQRNTTYTCLLDPAGAFTADRSAHYHMELLQSWGNNAKHLIVLTNAASADFGFIACSDSGEWSNWNISEKYTTTMPLDSNEQDTWPLGVSLDLTSLEALPSLTPDDPAIPAPPVLMILNNIGELLALHCVNTHSGGAYPGMVAQISKIPGLEKKSAAGIVTPNNTALATPKISAIPTASFSFATSSSTLNSTAAPLFGGMATAHTAKSQLGASVVSKPSDAQKSLFNNVSESTPLPNRSLFGAPSPFSVASNPSNPLSASASSTLAPPFKTSFAKPSSDGLFSGQNTKSSFATSATSTLTSRGESTGAISDKLATTTPLFGAVLPPTSMPTPIPTFGTATNNSKNPVPMSSTIATPKKTLLPNPATANTKFPEVKSAALPSSKASPTTVIKDDMNVLVARFDDLYTGLTADFELFKSFSKDAASKIDHARKPCSTAFVGEGSHPTADMKKLTLGDLIIAKTILSERLDKILDVRKSCALDTDAKDELLAGILTAEAKCTECESRFKVIQDPEAIWSISQNVLGPEAADLRSKLNAKRQHVQDTVAHSKHMLESLEDMFKRHSTSRSEHAKASDWKTICSTVQLLTKSGMAASSRIDKLTAEFHMLGINNGSSQSHPNRHGGTPSAYQRNTASSRASPSLLLSRDSPAKHRSRNVFGLCDDDVYADDSVLQPSPQAVTDPAALAAHSVRRRGRLILKQVLTRSDRRVLVTTSGACRIPPKELLKRPLPPRPAAPVITTTAPVASTHSISPTVALAPGLGDATRQHIGATSKVPDASSQPISAVYKSSPSDHPQPTPPLFSFINPTPTSVPSSTAKPFSSIPSPFGFASKGGFGNVAGGSLFGATVAKSGEDSAAQTFNPAAVTSFQFNQPRAATALSSESVTEHRAEESCNDGASDSERDAEDEAAYEEYLADPGNNHHDNADSNEEDSDNDDDHGSYDHCSQYENDEDLPEHSRTTSDLASPLPPPPPPPPLPLVSSATTPATTAPTMISSKLFSGESHSLFSSVVNDASVSREVSPSAALPGTPSGSTNLFSSLSTPLSATISREFGAALPSSDSAPVVVSTGSSSVPASGAGVRSYAAAAAAKSISALSTPHPTGDPLHAKDADNGLADDSNHLNDDDDNQVGESGNEDEQEDTPESEQEDEQDDEQGDGQEYEQEDTRESEQEGEQDDTSILVVNSDKQRLSVSTVEISEGDEQNSNASNPEEELLEDQANPSGESGATEPSAPCSEAGDDYEGQASEDGVEQVGSEQGSVENDIEEVNDDTVNRGVDYHLEDGDDQDEEPSQEQLGSSTHVNQEAGATSAVNVHDSVNTSEALSSPFASSERFSVVPDPDGPASDAGSFDIVGDHALEIDQTLESPKMASTALFSQKTPLQSPQAQPFGQPPPDSSAGLGSFGSSNFFGCNAVSRPLNAVNPMFGVASTTSSPVASSTPISNNASTTGGLSFGRGSASLGLQSGAPAVSSFGSMASAFGASPSVFGSTPSAFPQPQFGSATPLGAASTIPAYASVVTPTPSATSSFGSLAQQQTAQPVFGQSSFGAASANVTSFGGVQRAPVFGQSGFGSLASGTGGPSFGNASSLVASAASISPGGGFGSFATSGGGFAAFAMQQPAASTGSIFGSGGSSSVFGSTPQASAFGSTPQASAFGSTPQASAFGSTPQASAFGSTPQASAFGSTPQASAFGSTSQASAFGSTPQASAFGSTQQQQHGSAFGSTQQQGSIFGSSQGSAFGSSSQGSAFGSTQQESAFGSSHPQGSAFGKPLGGSSFSSHRG
ncbi:hypothetical protein BASA83_011633 [Batrachochytrium salamandrivorans]|nr:hypothetical protein BASA83_011633 [Batrachochytrium salamandrivorans]